MDKTQDEELLLATDTPDISILQQVYATTVNDLEEWRQQRQLDYNARRNIWAGKSDDFRKHKVNSETGKVFPFEGAADHEVYDIDDHIRANKCMAMNALRRATINATPVGHDDTESAAIKSQYMRWNMETKMPGFYEQADLAIDNFLEKGCMITHQYWEVIDQKVRKKIKLSDVLALVGNDENLLMSGQADEVLSQHFVEKYDIEPEKALEVIDELRLAGEAEVVATIELHNRPCMRALMPDEDVFFPPDTKDPQKAPYAFLDVTMTAEEVVSRGAKEEWDEEFIEKAKELAQNNTQPQLTDIYGHTREKFLHEFNNNQTMRITYMYRRLVDNDGVAGVYCTVFARGVEDLYAKHFLQDYDHGDMPFVATPLERTDSRFYSARSFPEVGASAQQIVKAEQDGSIDNLSMRTLPPLLHPPGKPPVRWGPGVQEGVFRPDQYKYADIPAPVGDSYSMREEVRKMASKYFARADQEADPTEIQNKQQDLVNRVMEHFKKVFIQIDALCTQFGDEIEYFQVVGANQMQQYRKGDPSNRYDFWLDFDISTQDPANMVDRVKGVAELAQMLGVVGQYDNTKLFQIGASQLLPGAANQFILSDQAGQERAIEEERQAISQIMAGVPPNVREKDAHQLKMQYFQQWKQQPDIQQMLAANESLAERVQNYENQRMHQLQQQQNAVTGRLGGQDTGFGQTTDLQ